MRSSSLLNTTMGLAVNKNVGTPAPFSPAISSMGKLNTGSVIATAGVSNFLMTSSHQIHWSRETIMLQDYYLLKAFAKKIIDFQKFYQQLEKTLSATALEEDSSPQLYTSNSMGGFAYVPLNKLGAMYNSSVNMNLLKMLAGLSYEYLPKTGNRNMQLTYSVKGFPSTTINKTFTY